MIFYLDDKHVVFGKVSSMTAFAIVLFWLDSDLESKLNGSHIFLYWLRSFLVRAFFPQLNRWEATLVLLVSKVSPTIKN